jgi:hypothetical protein
VGGKWTAIALAALVSAAHGCGAGPTFLCSEAGDCGADGICEANGGCSFPDDSCDSGRRFAKYTASANECVPLDMGSTSTTANPTTVADTLEPQTSSSTSGATTSTDQTSTGADILPETTSGGMATTFGDGTESTGGSSSSGGQVQPYDFYDDFERPDADDVENGWVEKTPDAFAVVDGGIRRVGSMGSYPRNLVYRPGEEWLDAETTLELTWIDISKDYGSPQCVLRTQLEDIDVPDSVTGYLLFVSGGSGDVTITRQIAGTFTQEHVTPLAADPIVGDLYRLRLRVQGTDPVMLDGYLEHWTGEAWEIHTEVHGMDASENRLTTPGTLAVGGHQQLGLWTYESIGLDILD